MAISNHDLIHDRHNTNNTNKYNGSQGVLSEPCLLCFVKILKAGLLAGQRRALPARCLVLELASALRRAPTPPAPATLG